MRPTFRLSTLCLLVALTCLVISTVIPAGGGLTSQAAVALATAIMYVVSVVGTIAALTLSLYPTSHRYQHAIEFLLFIMLVYYLHLVANLF